MIKLTNRFTFFLIPQQQSAVGSLHNIDFGVFWRVGAVLGRSRVPRTGSANRFRELVPGTGSGNRFWEPVLGDGFSSLGNQFWEPGPGFDGFGSKGCARDVSKVSVFHGFRGVRFCSRGFDGTVSGTGFQEPKALRRFRAKVSDSYSVLRKYTLVL